MAKAPSKNTIAKMRTLEKRAEKKLERFKSQGVRTGSITPIRPVDVSNQAKVKKYIRELETFNSRQTQYIAGRDGTPLDKKKVSEYLKLEKKWNKAHDKFWKREAMSTFYTPEGASDTTLGMKSSYAHVKGLPFGDIGYNRKADISKIRGNKDLQRRIDIMRIETSPEYERNRLKKLRENMKDFAAGAMNDKALYNMVDIMTDEQLLELWQNSDFVEMFYHSYPGKNGTSVSQAFDRENDIRHMRMLFKSVYKRIPGKRTRTQPTPITQPTKPKTTVSHLLKKSNKRRHRR